MIGKISAKIDTISSISETESVVVDPLAVGIARPRRASLWDKPDGTISKVVDYNINKTGWYRVGGDSIYVRIINASEFKKFQIQFLEGKQSIRNHNPLKFDGKNHQGEDFTPKIWFTKAQYEDSTISLSGSSRTTIGTLSHSGSKLTLIEFLNPERQTFVENLSSPKETPSSRPNSQKIETTSRTKQEQKNNENSSIFNYRDKVTNQNNLIEGMVAKTSSTEPSFGISWSIGKRNISHFYGAYISYMSTHDTGQITNAANLYSAGVDYRLFF